jgi:hypothetical protein
MLLRIMHHTAAAYLAFAHLKLWLDEHHAISLGF